MLNHSISPLRSAYALAVLVVIVATTGSAYGTVQTGTKEKVTRVSYVTADTEVRTTSTSSTQAPDMTVTFSTRRSGPAVIWFNAELSRINSEVFSADITITVDGNSVLSHTEDFVGEEFNEKDFLNMNWVIPDLPKGTHTIAINWFVSADSGVPGAEIRMDNRSLIVAHHR